VFRKITVVVIVFCLYTPLAFAKQSSNVSDSVNPYKAAEGRNAFARQMEGSKNKALDLHLAPGIDKDELSKLVFGQSFAEVKRSSVDKSAANDSDFQGLVMHQWPGREGVYIGVGCIGKMTLEPFSNHGKVYACAFKMLFPHSFQIIASLKPGSQFDCDAKDSDTMAGGLDELVALDLATFKISPSDYAIGLRLGHNEGYAGGIGYQENLVLLMQKGDALIPVFNHLVYQMQYLAGDWNKDGTRQHDAEENGKFVLSIESNITNGFYPIVLKQTIGGQSQLLYTWNSKQMKYDRSK
jgi:hypothetical protein